MSGVALPFQPSIDRTTPGSSGRPGFRSFKCTEPIAYTRRCCRDALIQSTLDPMIAALFPLAEWPDAPRDTFFLFGAKFKSTLWAIALCEVSSGVCLQVPAGYEMGLALNRAQVLSEPRCSTVRAIWSRRNENVSPVFQIELLRLLSEQSDGVEIRELAAWPPFIHGGIEAILSMATKGLLQLLYKDLLTDQTRIRLGPVAADYSLAHFK